MPIYEYVCMSCESHFEELVRMDDESPSCPDCGTTKVTKQFSAFAAHSSGSSTVPQPGFRGVSGGGGGCCGGGCGCG
ncbi:MAG TPA: zinc ribbon domain-containing protein [Gaiellaceae bacterium]|nr:zinc ribbon domain-containing protein [Gaiellaceae bacterium]